MYFVWSSSTEPFVSFSSQRRYHIWKQTWRFTRAGQQKKSKGPARKLPIIEPLLPILFFTCVLLFSPTFIPNHGSWSKSNNWSTAIMMLEWLLMASLAVRSVHCVSLRRVFDKKRNTFFFFHYRLIWYSSGSDCNRAKNTEFHRSNWNGLGHTVGRFLNERRNNTRCKSWLIMETI